MRRLWILLVAAVLMAACAALEDLPAEPVQGSRAPDFELENTAGERIALRDLQGRAVVVNFWATWCLPCRFEMPVLDAAVRQYPDGLVLLAVNFDESREQVLAYAAELGFSFDPLLDPGGEIYRLYQVRGLPTTFFIDSEGIIQNVHIGELNESLLAGYLNGLGLP